MRQIIYVLCKENLNLVKRVIDRKVSLIAKAQKFPHILLRTVKRSFTFSYDSDLYVRKMILSVGAIILQEKPRLHNVW